MSQNTLSYQRKARAAVDGHDGLLYLHRWLTGYQFLIFPSADAAARWLGACNR